MLKKAQETSNVAVLDNQKLNHGFELWNEPLVDAQHLVAMQKACAAVKDEFSNYSARFNTPAKLTRIEQDMANLKVCYEQTPTELKTNHICPHCHYNLGEQAPNAAGQLDNLALRIDDLVTEWTQTLLNTISDPIVANQKEYLNAEQQEAIDDFIALGTLPKRVDDFFIKAIQALLKGFEPVVVDAKDLMDKLMKLPPMDEATFKQKLNELIADYTKGKDEGKLRIIVK